MVYGQQYSKSARRCQVVHELHGLYSKVLNCFKLSSKGNTHQFRTCTFECSCAAVVLRCSSLSKKLLNLFFNRNLKRYKEFSKEVSSFRSLSEILDFLKWVHLETFQNDIPNVHEPRLPDLSVGPVGSTSLTYLLCALGPILLVICPN
jgi:hypothetical protein